MSDSEGSRQRGVGWIRAATPKFDHGCAYPPPLGETRAGLGGDQAGLGGDQAGLGETGPGWGGRGRAGGDRATSTNWLGAPDGCWTSCAWPAGRDLADAGAPAGNADTRRL